MADELNQQTAQQTNTEVQESAAPAFDLAASMAIALNGGIAPQETNTAITEPASTEGAAVVTAQETTQNDPFGLFKEKFGWETPEAAIQDIERLRAFEAQPRTPEFTVADDESGRILKALADGRKEEVWKALDHEMRIERLISTEVNKDNAGDIVKMGMALKYKDLTPDEINYKFNKQFSIPPKPTQTLEEEDTDFQVRLAVWQEQANDRHMELMIEAKLAKPELQNAKGKLEFPDIEAPVDEGYIQYQKMLEENIRQDVETKEAYQKLTPQVIETKLNFKDEANKIAFEFQYQPDAEKFKRAVEIASNSDLFWKTFMNSDGSPNRPLFLKSIMYALDEQNMLMSAMNQAKNATIKASLPDNSQGGLVRQIPQSQEPNELERNMQVALAGYGAYKH